MTALDFFIVWGAIVVSLGVIILVRDRPQVPDDWRPLRIPDDQGQYSGQVLVQSSGSLLEYLVDLDERTCNCPDFQETRAHLSHDSPGRFCKHMIEGFTYLGMPRSWDKLLSCVMAHGRCKPMYFRGTLRSGREIGVGFGDGRGWADVFLKRDNSEEGPFTRFGFSAPEQRWAKRQVPPDEREVLSILRWLSPRIGDMDSLG